VIVALNGLVQREGTDFTWTDQTLSLLSPMGALTGDVVDVHYLYDPDDPIVVPVSVDGIEDTFERADGVASVPHRSDGGLWETAADVGDSTDRWTIDDGKVVKLTDGFYVSGILQWLKADYGDLDEFTIELGIYSPNPYGHQWINFGGYADHNDDSGGCEIYLGQYEAYFTIQAPKGTTIYNTLFTVHGWETVDTTVIHPMTVTYSRITGHLTVDFEGEIVYDDDTGWIAPGTFLGVGCDKTGNGFAYIRVTAGI
jgi:hypothetical protein